MTERPGGEQIASRATAARWLALAVVAFDVVDIRLGTGYSGPLLTLAGLVAVLCLNDGDHPSVGMRFAPIQGWWYWSRLALWFGFWIGIVLAVLAGVLTLLGQTIQFYSTEPTFGAFFRMCVYAPFEEEIVYRLLLTVALAPTLGQRGTIFVSGSVFALIHILGGNPSPENQIAGFLLEWAYLRSGTILVPIAMHSVGNLIALGSQFAGWYWLAYAAV